MTGRGPVLPPSNRLTSYGASLEVFGIMLISVILNHIINSCFL